MDERTRRFARAHASLTTVAVTGTNGKTTTTSMIEAIVAASGEPAARLTTLGAWVAGEPVIANDKADEFLRTVETAVEKGVRTLALETTSKALVYGIARRWPARVAVFTNLSRDHLEAHGSAEAYLAAKAQLFMALPRDGAAILNADDPSAALIAEVLPASVQPLWFSRVRRDVDLATTEIVATAAGTEISLAPSALADALGGTLSLRAPGEVHVANALAAALAAHALGYAPRAIRDGLRSFGGVPGRFEIVARAPLVVVDYAHTPDGLLGTLTTARSLVPANARVVCVFGCGGGRDRGKRGEMGAIAARLADVVIITNDNPRHEDPDRIAKDICDGMPLGSAEVILDRRDAITRAISRAHVTDVVVIAGKGHETIQEVAAEARPFSDVEVARAVLAGMR